MGGFCIILNFSHKDRLCILIGMDYLLYSKWGIMQENEQYLSFFTSNTHVLMRFEEKMYK